MSKFDYYMILVPIYFMLGMMLRMTNNWQKKNNGGNK